MAMRNYGPIADGRPNPMGLLARSFVPNASAPPVAYPPGGALPPTGPGPDVNYPGGIQNFWSNNGRTFNIPAGASLAENRAQFPAPGPGVPAPPYAPTGKGSTPFGRMMEMSRGPFQQFPTWTPPQPAPAPSGGMNSDTASALGGFGLGSLF